MPRSAYLHKRQCFVSQQLDKFRMRVKVEKLHQFAADPNHLQSDNIFSPVADFPKCTESSVRACLMPVELHLAVVIEINVSI